MFLIAPLEHEASRQSLMNMTLKFILHVLNSFYKLNKGN